MNGLPFEIKSIYGLSSSEQIDGEVQDIKGVSDDSSKECTICMSEPSNVIIMPCGHMCVCQSCGEELKKSKHNMCPVCRGAIQSLVPLNRG